MRPVTLLLVTLPPSERVAGAAAASAGVGSGIWLVSLIGMLLPSPTSTADPLPYACLPAGSTDGDLAPGAGTRSTPISLGTSFRPAELAAEPEKVVSTSATRGPVVPALIASTCTLDPLL